MDTDLKLEQIEKHIENRNKILLELREMCKKNLYLRTIDLGRVTTYPFVDTHSEIGGKQDSGSSFVEGILMETNGKSFNEFTEESNTKCYRCKHFQNIPQNILEDCEKTSNLAERYEADLMFVQATVWLKSITRIMKDISYEQFRLVFHKQWNSVLHKSNAAEIDTKNIRSRGTNRAECLNAILSFNAVEECALTLVNNRDCTNFDSSNNARHKKHDIIQFGQGVKQNGEHFLNTSGNSSNFSSQSTRSYIRSVTENPLRFNYVVPDSQNDYSSCSDIFKDSLGSENARKVNHDRMENQLYDENSLMDVGSIELAPFQSQDELSCRSDSSQTVIPESKSDLSVNSAEGNSIDVFNENCSLFEESVDDSQTRENKWTSKLTAQKMTQYSRTSASRFRFNKLTISSNHTDQLHSLVNDECVPLNSKIDCITPRKKRSVLDSFEFPAVNIDEKEWNSDENQESSLSSLSSLKLSLRRGTDKSTDSTRVIQSSGSDQRCPRKEENLMKGVEFIETRGKRRKMEFKHETDIALRKDTKNEEKRISSKWLRFTLDALNTDDVAFQSMKVILSVLQNEKLAMQYMQNRCWKNTLEMQAVNAVLNFCDIFQTENKNDACTNEIVQAITHILDRSIRNTELNKVTILTHRISIILELCASMGVCVEIINYLTTKLKSYESILISLMNSRKADVHDTLNQLHIIFYSLSICLNKYRSVVTNKTDDRFEEGTTLSVIELWKKQLKFEGVIVKESIQARERRWQMILNDFGTIAIESFVPFTKMSRRLLNILMH